MKLSQKFAICSGVSASLTFFVCLFFLFSLLSDNFQKPFLADKIVPLSVVLWLCSLISVFGAYFYIKKDSPLALLVQCVAGVMFIVPTGIVGLFWIILGENYYSLMLLSTAVFSLISIFLTVTGKFE